MGVGGWTDNHSIPDQNLYHIIISYMIYNVSQHLKKLHQGRSFGDANAARYLAKIYKESNSTIFFFSMLNVLYHHVQVSIVTVHI